MRLNPSTEYAEIRPADAPVEGAHFSFYIRSLSDDWFSQDPKKREFLRTPSVRRENVFLLGWLFNMIESGPSSTHLDPPWASAQVSKPEKRVSDRCEKMPILSLRTLRLPVYDRSGVQVRFNQQSRHRWEGVLKFLARVCAWLPNCSNKCLNFQNRKISHL